jgi:AcrR family transcriptional regulator
MANRTAPPHEGKAHEGEAHEGKAHEGKAPETEHKWPQTVKERSTRAHGRRTLVKLLDAAEAEFAANGWHGARMARLAKRAGTAHGTVYAYFADKDDLLFALWQDVGAELRTTLFAMPPLEPGPEGFALIKEWVTDVCACFRRHAPVFHAMAEALADEENSRGVKAALRDQRRILAVFEERIRATGSSGIDPAMAALCIYALIEGTNESLQRNELLVSEDELVTGLAEFIQRAIYGSGAAPARRSPRA